MDDGIAGYSMHFFLISLRCACPIESPIASMLVELVTAARTHHWVVYGGVSAAEEAVLHAQR
jgi:hypothetical protein